MQSDAWSLKCIRIKEKAQLSQSMTVVACFVATIRRFHAWSLGGVVFGGFSLVDANLRVGAAYKLMYRAMHVRADASGSSIERNYHN